MRLALALLVPLALPALADDRPLTGAEFEALVEGRTLSYGEQGLPPYGVEAYHAGRAVTWAWTGDDQCSSGRWWEEDQKGAPAICFLYEHDPKTPKCWRVYQVGRGLRATFLNDGGSTLLYEILDDPGALVCGGAGV